MNPIIEKKYVYWKKRVLKGTRREHYKREVQQNDALKRKYFMQASEMCEA